MFRLHLTLSTPVWPFCEVTKNWNINCIKWRLVNPCFEISILAFWLSPRWNFSHTWPWESGIHILLTCSSQGRIYAVAHHSWSKKLLEWAICTTDCKASHICQVILLKMFYKAQKTPKIWFKRPDQWLECYLASIFYANVSVKAIIPQTSWLYKGNLLLRRTLYCIRSKLATASCIDCMSTI